MLDDGVRGLELYNTRYSSGDVVIKERQTTSIDGLFDKITITQPLRNQPAGQVESGFTSPSFVRNSKLFPEE